MSAAREQHIEQVQQTLRQVEQALMSQGLTADQAREIFTIAVERNLVPAGVESTLIRHITIPFSSEGEK